MYWATLLGKKVIVFPFSSRFYGMKHQPQLCDISNWKNVIKNTTCYSEALEECRQANTTFYNDYMNLNIST